MIRERVRIIVRGAVQGVGFRPFVYRLAMELLLEGWVVNSGQGVSIEVEGGRDSLNRFLLRLEKERPACAIIQSLESSFLDPVNYSGFEIRESEEKGDKSALILPDIATCADCLREIFNSGDRRFGYPFTNCTNCGPRFTIIEALPYDRAHTSMKRFAMCADCEREYHDPADRRFHAQPNACPRCGPQLQLWDCDGKTIAFRNDALRQAVDALRAGQILALKGLGGFQLLVDAANEGSVTQLRKRKHREEKPFAIMVSSLARARELCRISDAEERLLASPEAPIVLLEKENDAPLARSLAPGNPNLGVMLPYTPLHHLLLLSFGFPIVATSGNLSDEPICIDEREAIGRLNRIADLFLVHDRPIVRHMDDSIARIMAGREMVLRRSRGYSPLPVWVGNLGEKPGSDDSPERPVILALGGHLKSTIALGLGANIFVSQHIGDLETEQAYAAFVRSAADLPRLYDVVPQIIACDMHPEYLSSKYAAQFAVPINTVQHHWAHVAACMAENELSPPLLGVAWDGTGYGDDGTIWGGEFLAIDRNGFTRVAHLRQFPLPGSDAAVREPRRSALGLLYEVFAEQLWRSNDLLDAFNEVELSVIRQMLEKNVNAPLTSSAGRLFDAIASMIGLRSRVKFEGQAAMELEFALQSGVEDRYSFILRDASPAVVDWQPGVLEIIEDLRSGKARGRIAAKFHNMLTDMIVAVAKKTGHDKIVLSGGCFQNRYLTERTIDCLSAGGLRPYWHQRIPPNDGGISLGQVFATSMFGELKSL